MANRLTDRQRLALKLDTMNDNEVEEVLDYISIMESMRRAKVSSVVWEDDIVQTLSERPENIRARQAHEWEAVRRRAERRAATLSPRG